MPNSLASGHLLPHSRDEGFATTKRFLVTGGAGFIGSAVVVRHLIQDTGHEVCVLDKLTMRASPGRVPNLSVERDLFTDSILVRA